MRANLLVNGQTPDPLLGVVKAEIDEGLNELAWIDLLVARRERLTLDEMEQLVESPVSLMFADVVEDEERHSRWDGKIYEVEERLEPVGEVLDIHTYRLAIRPSLWDLSFNVTYRSFADKTRPETINEVFSLNGLRQGSDFDFKYFEKDFVRFPQIEQDWISDLEFVMNQMRPEGICLVSEFDDRGEKPTIPILADHAMFLTDKLEAPLKLLVESGMQAAGRRVTWLRTAVRSVAKTIKSTKEDAKQQDGRASGTISVPHVSPAGNTAVGKRVRLLMEAQEASRVIRSARSDAFNVHPGTSLEVEAPDAAIPEKMRIVDVHHRAEQQTAPALDPTSELQYTNEFRAVSADAPIVLEFGYSLGAGPRRNWANGDDRKV